MCYLINVILQWGVGIVGIDMANCVYMPKGMSIPTIPTTTTRVLFQRKTT